jgi:type IV fimbrial biogenesis protein FimT
MKIKHAGFTFVELMVTLAIMAIIAGIAAPSLSSLIANYRLTASANTTLAAIHMARAEAFKRGKRIVVCTSTNASSCDNTATWASGWIVFVDDNNNNSRDTGSAAEPLLRVGEASPNINISGSNGAQNSVAFTTRGATTFAAGSPTITFGISGQASRVLSITPTGRASVSKGSTYP